jgi:hypothetical protein
MSKGLELLFDAFDSVASNLIPAADNTYDVGSTSLGWKRLLVNDGTAAAPSLSFSDDPDTGFFRDTANEIAFAANGVKYFELEANILRSTTGTGVLHSFGSWLANGTQVNVLTSAGTGATLSFGTRGRISNAAAVDGNFVLSNNAATDFGLLQLGGTTSSFPALKRDGSALAVRLADDSAAASIRALTLNTASAWSVGNSAMASGSGHAYWFSNNVNASAGTYDLKISRSAAAVLSVQSTTAASGASLELFESASAPDAPAANGVRIYAKDVGAKTALFARFESGAEVQIAIDP